MARHQTAEEAKDENVVAMGKDLGLIYSELWQQLGWLHEKWAQYVVLFGTRQSRVQLLNASAPMFFRVVQDTLWEDAILHIARLTDSEKSCGKRTLSIRSLPSLIGHPETKSKVELLIKEALDAADFCRDWRNRRLAHRDLELALKTGAAPLKAGSREKVWKAIESLEKILNAISEHYLDSTTAFDLGTHADGALALLYVIDDGMRAEKSRKHRIKSGKGTPEDWEHRDL